LACCQLNFNLFWLIVEWEDEIERGTSSLLSLSLSLTPIYSSTSLNCSPPKKYTLALCQQEKSKCLAGAVGLLSAVFFHFWLIVELEDEREED